ncbi:hypothetical protein ACLBVW_37695, partial [Pseudomonas aeruginosa]|uniref:hypothetical protein n=1 Tax=Pseudomonas aeruginosa TaxID=287 RepID=UPI00396A0749
FFVGFALLCLICALTEHVAVNRSFIKSLKCEAGNPDACQSVRLSSALRRSAGLWLFIYININDL